MRKEYDFSKASKNPYAAKLSKQITICLDEDWLSLEEVQEFATRWMWSYNNDRPNMALGGFTPKQKLAMAA